MTQFVWSHIESEAGGDELRFAIRSVYRHFSGDIDIVLVGERPAWYCGKHIPIPRIPAPTDVDCRNYHGLLDTISKMYVISGHPMIEDQFVSMMDDHYFVKKVNLGDLLTPRITPAWSVTGKGWWHKAIVRTMQVLERRGLSTQLFDTHLMHVFEKDKMRKLIADFELLQTPLLRNTIYGNIHRKNPKNCKPFVATPQAKQTRAQLDSLAKTCTVLNHGAAVWDQTLRSWLLLRFPDASPVEQQLA